MAELLHTAQDTKGTKPLALQLECWMIDRPSGWSH